MTVRIKLTTFVCTALALCAFCIAPAPQANARAQYNKEFKAKYSKTIKKVSCKICHPEKSKKVRNDYGQALAKEIKEENVKDKTKIVAALDAVAKMKSSVEGKTFGDLIEEGTNPGDK